MATEKLTGWKAWSDVKATIEWVFQHSLYKPSSVQGADDRYSITFNLTDQVRRVSTWVFEYELDDERTRQANAIDLRRKLP